MCDSVWEVSKTEIAPECMRWLLLAGSEKKPNFAEGSRVMDVQEAQDGST